jgi:hypothetical protein
VKRREQLAEPIGGGEEFQQVLGREVRFPLLHDR